MTEIIIQDEKTRSAAIDLLSRLDLKKRWRFTLVKYVKRRSLDQNARYWAILVLIAKETGNDQEMIHEALKVMFLKPETITLGDRTFQVWTSRNKNTPDFATYMNQVEGYAASEYGVQLPFDDSSYRRDN